jgi:CheY-like chemotaxis protein
VIDEPGFRTILVVDDDADIRDAMSLVLDHSGYRTVTAANGEEALAALAADRSGPSESPIDLILLDMMMPIMDGWRFRDSQRAVPEIAGIPVVVLTGDGRAKDKAAALGAAGYLKKPLDLDELLAIVKAHVVPPTEATLEQRADARK